MRFAADENFDGRILTGLRGRLPSIDIVRIQFHCAKGLVVPNRSNELSRIRLKVLAYLSDKVGRNWFELLAFICFDNLPNAGKM
jgi:hypothetical protein